MNYKLAKKLNEKIKLAKRLKEAGFPQKNCFMILKTSNVGFSTSSPTKAPTLEELIEACGDVSLVIWKYENQWMAGIYKCGSDIYVDDYPNPKGDGDTPLEAVANLWLKLNEKK